ncbi:acyltransferase [Luteolibacter arcticus]|uniref:Acyltransferase n=1 Tax=Luteolibacter arcticus TaxID=1581411 RepID=A0ABT3GJ49_9BACT|nr:acyltransferase [Luteolibacter arcticus]MCW1923525.1 acyltransferase [Luteolibacter arcticus]
MSSPRGKIVALESLRGYLAMWVVAQHLIDFCGGHLAAHPWGSVLAESKFAVQGFMILSGFVIAHLITARRESYGVYMGRRLFRIYPVLLLAAISGILLHQVVGVLLHQWWPSFFTTPKLAHFAAQWEATDGQFSGNCLAVLTMTNGLIPPSLLPYAPTAFIGVLWSLSLEFQFYVVAPLLHRLLNHNVLSRVGLLVGLAIFLAIRQPLFGQMKMLTYPSFLPFSIEFFVIGMVSHSVYLWICRHTGSLREVFADSSFSLVALVIVAILLVTGDDLRSLAKGHLTDYTGRWTAIIIWILMMAWLTDGLAGRTGLAQRIGKFLFESRWPLYLGKISYSVYLWHVPVILAVQWFLYQKGLAHTWQDCLIWTTAIALPLTFVLSVASYHLVELPFIRLGSKWFHSKPIAP